MLKVCYIEELREGGNRWGICSVFTMLLLQTGGLHDYGKGERVHFTPESVRGPLFFREH